jgi:hypothetical protein
MQVADGIAVACTLRSKDLNERQAWIRRVTDESLVWHTLRGNSITLTYLRAALDDIRAVVEKEQECCAFLTFEIQVNPKDVVLTITSPPETRESARWLFAQFLPGPTVHSATPCGCAPGRCN